MKVLILISLIIVSNISICQSYDEISVDSLENWIKQRVENAQNGVEETIEMPFVVKSLGWGCVCPEHYIGVSTNSLEGPWISPIVPNGFPISDENGHSLIVIGHFTGKMITLALNSHFYEESNEYVLPEFRIISWSINSKGYEVEAPKVVK